MSMSKYKKISDLVEKDVIEILEKIYECESNNHDDFSKIWDIFTIKFDNSDLFKRDKTTKEFEDPIVKVLYKKFKDFFDRKEDIKNEINKLKEKLSELKNEN